MSKNKRQNILIIITMFAISILTSSCKDNIISNAYLNLTQSLRIDDNNNLNNDNKLFRIIIKDFLTSQEIAGAEVTIKFSNDYYFIKNSDENGIIEIDYTIIPKEDFDIIACYSKNNIQYHAYLRKLYLKNDDKTCKIYLIKGKCNTN